MFVVKGMRSRIVIGGVITFSILSVLFPKSVGLVFGLFLGLIIMMIEQIGLKISNWGRDFGGWLGSWAIEFGEKMGRWAIGFTEIISRMNLLHSIQMFGFFVIIIAGLAILGVFINKFNRTDTCPKQAP